MFRAVIFKKIKLTGGSIFNAFNIAFE